MGVQDEKPANLFINRVKLYLLKQTENLIWCKKITRLFAIVFALIASLLVDANISVSAAQSESTKASSAATISLSLDSNNISLMVPTNGGIATGSHRALVVTNSQLGYNLTLSSTTTNADLEHSNGSKIPTIKTAGSLTSNTWGYTLDNPYNNPNSNTYQPIAPITNPATIADKDSASIVGTVHGVWYSVKVDNPTVPTPNPSSTLPPPNYHQPQP